MTRAQLAQAMVDASNEFYERGWDDVAERTTRLAQRLRKEAA